jgi:hypothetical protein
MQNATLENCLWRFAGAGNRPGPPIAFESTAFSPGHRQCSLEFKPLKVMKTSLLFLMAALIASSSSMPMSAQDRRITEPNQPIRQPGPLPGQPPFTNVPPFTNAVPAFSNPVPPFRPVPPFTNRMPPFTNQLPPFTNRIPPITNTIPGTFNQPFTNVIPNSPPLMSPTGGVPVNPLPAQQPGAPPRPTQPPTTPTTPTRPGMPNNPTPTPSTPR